MRNARFALLLLLLLLLPPIQSAAQAQPDGEAIFGESCASCHGPEGAGGRGPSLRGQLRNGTQDADLRKVILNGLPGTGMPKFDFGADDLRALVAYVRSFSRGAASAPHPVGDRAEGKRVYDSHGCSGCHKIGGEGSVFGPNLTRIGAARSYEYLRASILNPSSDVPEDYQGVTVVTRDGKRYSGVRVNEDSFTVQLRLPDQSFASFDKQAIERETAEKESPMPAYTLGEPDLKNLLAYLSGLVGSSNMAAGTTEEPKLK